MIGDAKHHRTGTKQQRTEEAKKGDLLWNEKCLHGYYCDVVHDPQMGNTIPKQNKNSKKKNAIPIVRSRMGRIKMLQWPLKENQPDPTTCVSTFRSFALLFSYSLIFPLPGLPYRFCPRFLFSSDFIFNPIVRQLHTFFFCLCFILAASRCTIELRWIHTRTHTHNATERDAKREKN